MSRLVGVYTLVACAVQATAFLLPPNVAPASDVDRATGYGLTSPLKEVSAIVQLPCYECAFSSLKETEKDEDELPFWIQGRANSVLVNFTIPADGQNLEVNGESIWPFQLSKVLAPSKVYVDQVRPGVSLADVQAGLAKRTPLEVTGHSVSVKPRGDDTFLPITYQIFEIEGQPVHLDPITIKLFDLPGAFMIVNLDIGSTESSTPEPVGLPHQDKYEDLLFPITDPDFEAAEWSRPESDGKKECNLLPAALCKLRNIVEAKITGIGRKGGCHGRMGARPHDDEFSTHFRPHPDLDADEHERPHSDPDHFFHPGMDEGEPDHDRPHEEYGRPHHMRPHHHHHHRHHRHHFMHAFTRGLATVLIPTLAGIAVGMTVSLVGLIVGRLIGFLWIRLYRGGRRGYASVAHDESLVLESDEEKVAVDEEPLPVYEDSPAYEEVVKETK